MVKQEEYKLKIRKRDFGEDISGWVSLKWKCPNCGETNGGAFDSKGRITRVCPHCPNLMIAKKEDRRCVAILNFGPRKDLNRTV